MRIHIFTHVHVRLPMCVVVYVCMLVVYVCMRVHNICPIDVYMCVSTYITIYVHICVSKYIEPHITAYRVMVKSTNTHDIRIKTT